MKINLKKLAYFFSGDSVVFPRHNYHAHHHVHTTEKPCPCTTFSQKIPEKHIFTTLKKIRSSVVLHPTSMESPIPPDKKPAISNPVLFIVIVCIVVAAIALFATLRPNPSGKGAPSPAAPAAQQ
ncbi:hypothetical protein [Granulicella sp. S190]|uniref:hypothetical protein n=1 Tax=Granulicella sp. S190 TaxID=1747226 RepID=UPI00131B9FFB|nr:hypothetical protein [Granulicella sp. S190]